MAPGNTYINNNKIFYIKKQHLGTLSRSVENI